MRIELSCRCGASGVWETANDSFGDAGPQVSSEKWLADHKGCPPRNEALSTVSEAEERATVALIRERLAAVTDERDHLVGIVKSILEERDLLLGTIKQILDGPADFDEARRVLMEHGRRRVVRDPATGGFKSVVQGSAESFIRPRPAESFIRPRP